MNRLLPIWQQLRALEVCPQRGMTIEHVSGHRTVVETPWGRAPMGDWVVDPYDLATFFLLVHELTRRISILSEEAGIASHGLALVPYDCFTVGWVPNVPWKPAIGKSPTALMGHSVEDLIQMFADVRLLGKGIFDRGCYDYATQPSKGAE